MECALTPDVTRVRAEGHALHSGRQLATAQARQAEPHAKLYAHATATCLVLICHCVDAARHCLPPNRRLVHCGHNGSP